MNNAELTRPSEHNEFNVSFIYRKLQSSESKKKLGLHLQALGVLFCDRSRPTDEVAKDVMDLDVSLNHFLFKKVYPEMFSNHSDNKIEGKRGKKNV